MEIKQNFDNLAEDVREYMNLRMNSVKFQLVEHLSQMSGDILSYLIFFFFFFVAFLFFLFALMIFLAQYIGLLLSALTIGCVMLVIALIVFANRKQLFADMFVSRFCKMFFPEKDVTNEEQ